MKNKEKLIRYCIYIILIVGLTVCVAMLFSQVRLMIFELAERVAQRKTSQYQEWQRALLSYAMGGIFFLILFGYCLLTASGKRLANEIKSEIRDCLAKIDWRSFIKPVLVMSGIYLLGILTIIRANFSYTDDLKRAIEGFRRWYDWSRYVSEFSSIFVHGDTNLTDISPLPQLLAVLLLSISSVLLVYVIADKKITVTRLLASIPLGLSPYFLGCLSFKFDAPYMALSVLASIVPFLFITHKKAFFFCSVVSLLIMCMTYQAASGIYPMIAVVLCFRYWNTREKTNNEVLSFLGRSVFAFCFAMLVFNFFLMKPYLRDDYYTSTAMYPVSHLLSGTWSNIKDYALIVNSDWGIIWKTCIILICILFIIKSFNISAQGKIYSFFVSIIVIGVSFILSYGFYVLLAKPIYLPRALIGFGSFLAILCIYVISDYNRIATIVVIALNWCLFVFAFSYGNALADQARYAEFRINILLHDLSALYPTQGGMQIQLKNSIDYTPSVKNIAKHYPVIERLVPRRLGGDNYWDTYYFANYFNFNQSEKTNITVNSPNENPISFDSVDLPVVLDSYYHTIQSDGNYILVVLKH